MKHRDVNDARSDAEHRREGSANATTDSERNPMHQLNLLFGVGLILDGRRPGCPRFDQRPDQHHDGEQFEHRVQPITKGNDDCNTDQRSKNRPIEHRGCGLRVVVPLAPVPEPAADAHRPGQGQRDGEQRSVDGPSREVVQQRHEQHAASHPDGCKHERDEEHAARHRNGFKHGPTAPPHPKWLRGGHDRS